MTITIEFKRDGSPIVMDSVVLSSTDGTYGVKRDDSDAVVVVDGTAMTETQSGVWQYEFTAPAQGLTYTYSIEFIESGTGLSQYTTRTFTDIDDSLITLSYAKQFLSIPSTDTASDDRISTLVAAASRAVEAWCKTRFHVSTYTEYHSGEGRRQMIVLNNTNVTAVTRLASCVSEVASITNTDDTTNQIATVRVTATAIELHAVASGVESTTSISLASNVTLAALKSAVEGFSGWSMTIVNGYEKWPSSYLLQYGPFDCMRTDAVFYMCVENLDGWQLNTGRGHSTIVGYMPDGFRNIEIKYTAGWSTIPELVQEATAALVKLMWDSTKTDAWLRRERIGDYEYERPILSPDGGSFLQQSPEIKAMLEPYRKVSLR